jgi:hypothetical protein
LEGCALASVAPILRTNEQSLSSFLGTFSTHTTSIFDSWRAPFRFSNAPLLPDKYTYKNLLLVGAAAPQGKLFLTVYALSITSQEVVLLLGQLLRIIAGLLLVIWDGIPTHRSRIVNAYLADGAARCIHLEQLPGYALALNPTDWV